MIKDATGENRKILEAINKRVTELNSELSDYGGVDDNHLSALVLGEIEGLVWVKEFIEEMETKK